MIRNAMKCKCNVTREEGGGREEEEEKEDGECTEKHEPHPMIVNVVVQCNAT